MTTIALSWPDAKLSPNWRGHWAVRSPVTKAARLEAYYSTKAAGAKVEGDGVIPMRLVFHAPDRRGRDRTNVEASCKAYFDGIADALGVNDVRFEPTYAWGEPVRGGAVVVTL